MLRATTTKTQRFLFRDKKNLEEKMCVEKYVRELIQHCSVFCEYAEQIKNTSYDVDVKYVTSGLP